VAINDLLNEGIMSGSEQKRLGEARDRRFEIEASLEPLFADGLITEVLGLVRKGKEANVYCCRGSRWSGREYVAAKVYRSLEQRGFQLPGSAKRALANKSRQGRLVQAGVWIHSEFETLQLLHAAGANVPEPISCTGSAILMEFIGDGAEAAPMLARVAMGADEARNCLRQILDNVTLWLRCDRIHGDLSVYNVLYRDGGIVVIDFPQAVDPRFNHNARHLLERDLENVCGHFARAGLHPDARRIASEMWNRYRVSGL
jgi:RIO kinase 1